MIFVFDRVENIVGKGENAGFPSMFSKGFLLWVCKSWDGVICKGWLLYVEKQPMAWKEYCVEYWLKKFHESKDRCTGCHYITEI